MEVVSLSITSNYVNVIKIITYPKDLNYLLFSVISSTLLPSRPNRWKVYGLCTLYLRNRRMEWVKEICGIPRKNLKLNTLSSCENKLLVQKVDFQIDLFKNLDTCKNAGYIFVFKITMKISLKENISQILYLGIDLLRRKMKRWFQGSTCKFYLNQYHKKLR